VLLLILVLNREAYIAMSLCVTGKTTTIIKELLSLIPNEEVISIGRGSQNNVQIDFASEFDVTKIPSNKEKYILAAGVLYPKTLSQQSFTEAQASFNINLISVVRICDYLLENNPKARIAIVGSESSRGSFDTSYFLSKVALNAYVEKRKLCFPEQQIVVVSPTIIMDSGMTQRRDDIPMVEKRAEQHPKKRFLMAAEVARMLHFVLWQDSGYISNTTIHINGGMFA
jgi:short-subunit dehydrogenase